MTGDYVLTRIDGQELPAAVPLPSAFGTCVPQVLFGTARVVPRIRDTYPLYTIVVRADPIAPPAACRGQYGSESPQDVVRDGGRWTGGQSGLRFASQLGAGDYDVRVGGASGSPTLAMTVRGHTLTFQRPWSDGTELMGVDVDVTDDSGTPVARSIVAVSQRGIVVQRRLEIGYGVAMTAAREPATLTVTPPPGYAVAPGQAASVTVAPAAGQRSVGVRFTLARTP